MDKLNTICRACNIEGSDLLDLSANAPAYADTLLLGDILFTVCPSLPMGEILPQQICYFCFKKMESAYKFQLQCMEAHKEQWRFIKSVMNGEQSPIQEYTQNENQQCYAVDKEVLHHGDRFENEKPILSEDLEYVYEEEIECESNGIDFGSYTEINGPNKCFHCKKNFHTHKGLLLHEKLTHKNLEPIARNRTIHCEYCSELFWKERDHSRHCRQHHKKELEIEFDCRFCHKVFVGKTKFKSHLLHHDKKQFVCTVKDCTRIFTMKQKVTDHIKRFHGINLSISERKAIKPKVNDEGSSI